LIEYQGNYLLTDPWFDTPAFGSWLPVPPLPIHPSYLTAIPNMSILISHGHDDHIDDQFLSLFDNKCPTITSNFRSKGLLKRIKKSQKQDIREAGVEGIEVGPFFIRSFQNESISLDDATYTISTPYFLVVHCNDCWNPITDELKTTIMKDINSLKNKENVLWFSQSNSASGYPLTYKNLTKDEKSNELSKKVKNMTETGLDNASQLSVKKFIGYAGYTSVFVHGREDYIKNSIFSSPQNLKSLIEKKFKETDILDLCPGQTFDFNKNKIENFQLPDFNLDTVRERSLEFYNKYDYYEKCDSFNPLEIKDCIQFYSDTEWFLEEFNNYIVQKISKNGYEKTILGKVLQIEFVDLCKSFTVEFGKGLLETTSSKPNKKIVVNSGIFNRVLTGKSWFENLYTGYNAEFERHPKETYNRDIVMYICSFSYYFKNRILVNKRGNQ